MNLILVELNEINFDVVQYYIDKGISLPAMEYMIESGLVITRAESEYDYLEPGYNGYLFTPVKNTQNIMFLG